MSKAKAAGAVTSGARDLWTLIQDKNSHDPAAIPRFEGSADTTVVFVGSKSSGKTCLITRFRTQNVAYTSKEDTKPTVALEYSHRPGKRENNNVKQVAHLWELGGGAMLEKLLVNCITPQNVNTAMAVITVDLADSGSVLDTAIFWLDRIRKLVRDAVAGIVSKTGDTPDRFQDVAGKMYGAEHPDKERVDPIGIPVIIIANKYDVFSRSEVEVAKTMSRALRFLAHMNGATLLYTSILQQPLIQNFLVLMNFHAFKTSPSKTVVTDHLKPLYVPVGQDNFQSIGRAPMDSPNVALWRESYIQDWKTVFYATFRPNATSDGVMRSTFNEFDTKYKEAIIDELRAVKDKNLELYRGEYEKKLEEERQKADRLLQAQLERVNPNARTSAPSKPSAAAPSTASAASDYDRPRTTRPGSSANRRTTAVR